MKSLNWKHILIHLIALWFFAFSFQTYAYLSNVPLSELLRHSSNPQKSLINHNYNVVSLTSLNLSIGLLHTLGLIIGLTVSVIIAIRQKLFWVNSLIAFLIIIVLDYLNLLGWNYLKRFFLLPGELSNGLWYYLINASIMFFIGLGLLLMKKSIDFIKRNNPKQELHYA